MRRAVALVVALSTALLASAAPAFHQAPGGRIVVSLGHDSTRENPTFAYRLFVLNASGSGLRQLTNGKSSDVHPAWSPDGRTIAFSRGSSDWDFGDEIWTIAADGTHAVNLTPHYSGGDHPAWSPDGKTIVYQVRRIWRMNADGSDRRPLSKPPKKSLDEAPWFSHDGQTILFVRQDDSRRPPRYAIWQMDADGSNAHPIIRLPASIVWEVRPSPGGRKIAYGSDTIHVMDADGSNDFDTKVRPDAIASRMAWAPDGSVVACVCHGNGPTGIQILDPLRRRLTLLVRLPVRGLNLSEGLDWSSR